MAMDMIRLRGARTHNLKNIDLDLPRDKLADEAHAQGVITKDEYDRLAAAEALRDDAIQVD